MNARRDNASKPDATAPATPVPAATNTGAPAKTGNNARWDADDAAWRHPPVAPVDESAAESLGRSVSDVVIGSADKPKGRPKP